MGQMFLDFHSYEEVLLKAHKLLHTKYKCLEVDYEKLNNAHIRLWRRIKSDSLMIEAKEEIDHLNDELERLRFENNKISTQFQELVVDFKKFGKMVSTEAARLKNDVRNRVN